MKEPLENGRRFPFTLSRRNICVEKIIKETGVDKWTAEVAYRISTSGLVGRYSVDDTKSGKKMP